MLDRIRASIAVYFMALVSVATHAHAGDQYQLIPIGSTVTNRATGIAYHNALVFNISTGDFYGCTARMKYFAPRNVGVGVTGSCQKVTANAGSIPPVPAILSFPNYNIPAQTPYLGFWKIDQATGAVTFCGAPESGGGYYCAVLTNSP
jgi:hypothetical protein